MTQPPFRQDVAAPAPAAPTQLGFPGQLPAQPQYSPAQGQLPPQQFATGFPTYVSPPPSPKNQTSLIVGTIVCVVVLLFAVIGFALVA